MAFSDNNPTFKYVKISGLNIIHEGISYRINDIYSSSKYFYWDKNKSPNELITSNIRITESASVFLICMNDRGIHTEVNHDELIYNFGGYSSGGGGGDISKTEFNALKVQVDENKEAYMNVSQSVEGIYQVVGDSEELEDGTIIKHINSLKQTSTSMDSKIQELNTKISDEYEELRDMCSDSLVDLLASISTLKIDFEYFAEEDEELSEEGKNVITTDIENTQNKLNTLEGIIDGVLIILNEGERFEEYADLNSAFTDMSTDITNMLSIINTAISDMNISSDDITTVILSIGTATQKINILKATVDEVMTLGLGGTIYDSYSQIYRDNERIRTTVKETESIVYGALKASVPEYYSSTSTDTLEGGGWQDTPPSWEIGRYIWQRIRHEYASGQISYSKPVCIAGAKGDRGEDGTSTKILGSYDTYEELVEAHPLDNENGDAYLIQGDLYVWTGTQFENVGQIKGEDGESAHIHIKYSNDGGQTFTGNNGEDTGLYIGIYSDFSVTDSSDVNDYKWSLIKGEDGKDGLNGIDGINGKDGVSIIWKGTATEHPSGAENGWAYYNSAQGKSFVYQDETWYQMSIDGTDGIQGNDGADGLSIVWKGEQKTPPSRPETNWVYRDTDNGIVYIYNGSAWEAMTYDGSDGVDGTNGTDGLSIVWKGESSEPPSNAEDNWVYRDTDDGIIYIYSEGEWVIMAVDGIDGVDGTNGINGSSLLIFTTDYSTNQSTIEVWSKEGYKRNWVVKEDITNVQAGDNALVKVNNSTRGFDCFIVVKVNSVNVSTSSINATSYGLVDKGEDGADGADGLSVFITYHDNIEKPDLPTGDGTTNGWHTDATDETRWMSQKVASSAEEGTWGEPIKIKGEDGTSVKILGVYDSLEELLSEHPSGTNQDGDGYLINGELYVWNDSEFLNVGKIKGEDGEKGEDGTSMYLHVKYSNDGGQTFTGNNGEDEGTYIGTYADHEEADSTDVTKYKWVKFSPQSLVKSTPQWYLSTSNTEQTGGSWTETMPELKEGYYLWLRYKLDWENPTQTTYTTPTLEQLYENMKEIIEKQATFEQDVGGFKTTVSETYTTAKDALDKADTNASNITTIVAKQSDIEQTVDEISAKISSVETIQKGTLKVTSVQYYLSTSLTELVGGSWQDTAPIWTSGKYMWQRMKYEYVDGEITYSTPICIAGAKGDTGATGATGATGEKGQSLVSSTPQWYLSSSNTSQTGGSWVSSMPTIKDGYYLWLRYELVWANPTATTYTTPTLEQVAEAVKVVVSKQTSFEEDLDGFKTTVSKTYSTISEVQTISSTVDQTADKISWVVSSGTSSSDMQLTDRMYSLITSNINLTADKIDLHGYVTANGNFKIDTSGNMEAKNGTFVGVIKSTSTSDNKYAQMKTSDFGIYNGSTKVISLGLRSITSNAEYEGTSNLPTLYMGRHGININGGTSYTSGRYYGRLIAYGSDSPNGVPQLELNFNTNYTNSSTSNPNASAIRIHGDGDITVAPTRAFEVRSHFINGSYGGGASETTIARFVTHSNDYYSVREEIQCVLNTTNGHGLILGDGYFASGGNGTPGSGGNFWTAVTVDSSIDSSGSNYRAFKSIHDNATNLGTSSYRWKNIYSTSGVVSTSDRRAKENIQYLSNVQNTKAITNDDYITQVVDYVKNIPYASFNMIGEEEEQLGFILQDLIQINPDITNKFLLDKVVIMQGQEDEDVPLLGYKTSNYINMLGMTIQHLLDRIEKLEEKNGN